MRRRMTAAYGRRGYFGVLDEIGCTLVAGSTREVARAAWSAFHGDIVAVILGIPKRLVLISDRLLLLLLENARGGHGHILLVVWAPFARGARVVRALFLRVQGCW